MRSRREKTPARTMKNIFVVFCEGETEEAYLNFIRSTYRSPIKIVPNIQGCSITNKKIQDAAANERITGNEKITAFAMYDLDNQTINARLLQLSAIHLFSNPCIELWFLLHTKGQTGYISTKNATDALKNAGSVWASYKKGILTTTQREYLRTHQQDAIDRAKSLIENSNPSSTIYRLLEELSIV